MSEDTFRLVVTAAVALACLAFIVQAGVAIGLYRVARKMQEKITPLAEKGAGVVERAGPVIDKIGPIMDKIGPVVEKIGPVVEQIGPVLKKAGAEVDRATAILNTTQKILEDVRPQVAEISKDVAAMTKTGRQQVERIGQQVERIGGLVGDASERARERLDQIDHSVSNTVEQVEHAGDAMKRAVLRPVREVNGLAAGISAVVSTLVHGSGRSSVDHATQDEEMFI